MPITHEISKEIEAVEFAINELTSQAKNSYGMSDGLASKREQLKNNIQALRSTLSRLKITDARNQVEQPRLF